MVKIQLNVQNIENMEYAIQINSESHNYTLGETYFADLTLEEFQNYFMRTHLQSRSCDSYSPNGKTTPDSWDWRDKNKVTSVKDQGQCGSCWAFSAIGTMEGAWFKKSGNLVSLSEQDIVDCVTSCYGCGGGWPYKAIDWVLNHSSSNLTRHNNSYSSNDTNNSGVDTESSYPYEAEDDTCRFRSNSTGATMKALVEIPSGSVSHLKDALFSVGPISVAIDAEEDLQMYKSGIYSSTINASGMYSQYATFITSSGIQSSGSFLPRGDLFDLNILPTDDTSLSGVITDMNLLGTAAVVACVASSTY